jgi:hypothetical protein
MRRRFGRRRWGGGGGGDDAGSEGGGPLDVGRELARVVEAGVVPAEALDPLPAGELPASLAAVGSGTARDGTPILVATSPVSGGDAWLAAVAVTARRVAEEGFPGTAYAVSPSWPLAARRRLGLLRPGALRLHARRLPDAHAGEGEVSAEAIEAPVVGPGAIAAELREPAMRALWQRASAALAGLAAKHGGSVRAAGGGIELVLLGRPVAALRTPARPEHPLVLEAFEPRRETHRLAPEAVSDAFDRLEGSLRKFLSERRARDGEAGVRAGLAAQLVEAAALRDALAWPLGGPQGEAIDLVGVDADGRGVVGAARGELGLAALGPILDGWVELVPRLPALLSASGPLRTGRPTLLLAAERFDAAVERVLGCLDLEIRCLAPEGGRRDAPLVSRALPPAAGAAVAVQPVRPPAPRPTEPRRPSHTPEFVRPEPVRVEEARAESVRTEGRVEAGEREAVEAGPRRRFEEFSLFDLADVSSEEPGRRRRRRRRGRGRGRALAGAEVGAGEDEGEAGEEDEAEPAESVFGAAPVPGERRRRRGRRRGREDTRGLPAPAAEASDTGELEAPPSGEPEEADVEEELLALAELPEVEVEPAAEPGLEEEEEEEEAESPEEARLRREREARRRARLAKVEPESLAERPARAPRRRSAFLVLAEREAIAAAVLLARDTRLVEGIWIYPQADLMTFFRSVATDLREDTPICVIGFTASPARETLQAASLYRDRLVWYDHHAWPPEDLEGLRAAIGREAVHIDPAAGGALPAVLAHCTRRSRFSDKLVDLVTGRFSRHDYERWGRLWWWRLGQLATRSGERRADLEPLIAGRPSDLAREAERGAPPPLPAEVEWVAARDFRLVHFGGYTMAMVPVPVGVDLHLAARIVRERYTAPMSLAWLEGDDRFVLGSDEATTGRDLDLGALVDHLAEKFTWVERLSDADHVARLRIAAAAAHPERVEEVVGEIAMGRSLLEG